MTVLFWTVIVTFGAFYIGSLVTQRRIERECKRVVEEFLSREK